MAIADTVWERLARFNAPLHRRDREGRERLQWAAAAAVRWLVLASLWLLVGLSALMRLLVRLGVWLMPRCRRVLRSCGRFAWAWLVPALAWLVARAARLGWRALPTMAWAARWVVLGVAIGLLARAAYTEINTSYVESVVFTRLDSAMHFPVQAGPSQSIIFPKNGPYDSRLGYAKLPEFITSLKARHFAVDSQAQWSSGLARFAKLGAFPIYPEKDQAGLTIFDRDGKQIYSTPYPQHIYRDFKDIPSVVIRSLLFIEDRYLLDPDEPRRNPAIEWKRFALAAVARVAGLVAPGLHVGGGSTLATQIEKFRHSPQGLTTGIGEKLRQMLTASARAYEGGPNTLQRRQEILATYLNSVPYSSMPGYGEVIGLPEALSIWFGTDYAEATRILNSTPQTRAELERQGEIYRQALSLLLSERRPSYYLRSNRDALETLTDRYLRVLRDAGVIEPALCDAALSARLHFRPGPPAVRATSYVNQKATDDVRGKLVSTLDLPDFYALDRLDLSVNSAVDTATQARVTAVLQRLADPAFLNSAGMVGKQLLGGGDPAKVNWSFVLYERGGDRNLVRVHADSLNEPFDINAGGKLMLGSTAKLRTLITYLDIMSDLHRRFAALPPRELYREAKEARDPLTGWVASYLARTRDRSLQPMLDAAMHRTYSAAAGSFFTGGGIQGFGNFESSENYETPTVETAFQHSINLAFVRLLHDIVTYETAASGVEVDKLLNNPDDPQRQAYLHRFVDADSRRFLSHYFKDYSGLNPNEALDRLVARTRPTPQHLATVYLSVHPHARIAYLQAFLTAHLPHEVITENELWDLYLNYSPERLNLADRGYVAGIHPLELWLVRYLDQHPNASWDDVIQASAEVRQQVYGWLFNGSLAKQDNRIRILLEQDAFERILENWRATGYPFARLVPSLGTAIGASGDRPDALADLMGIIMNDGVRVPTVSIDKLHFAGHTPYETNLSAADKPERVMPVEVAHTVRQALMGVVANGTAARLRGAYVAADGTPLPVGGKTGTGDNRFDRFGRGGGIISSRVVDRTATFVFFLGDRFFGTVTAYAPGSYAAHFHFTSALAVQLLKVLEPELKPLIDGPTGAPALVGSSRPPRAAVSAGAGMR
jgi:membrane peptidoglycan carboxypeptidase